MQKLGVLGGMGPAATYEFFKMLVNMEDAKTDQEHIDIVLLNHSSMPDRTAAIKSGNTENVENLLCADARFLEESGVSVIAMPCNTSHYFIDKIKAAVNIDVVNMVEAAVSDAVSLGRHKIAVLATEGTVMTGVYKAACDKLGVECFVPDDATQQIVTDIIYGQIKKGEKGRTSDFEKIDVVLKAEGCDAAILACTELSVFKENHKEAVGAFYIDAMESLARRAILRCGGKIKTF